MQWGVDLEQDGDTVPGTAGRFGGGHPEFGNSDAAPCRRPYGPSREWHCASVGAVLHASAHIVRFRRSPDGKDAGDRTADLVRAFTHFFPRPIGFTSSASLNAIQHCQLAAAC
jgi:hypothetical protein